MATRSPHDSTSHPLPAVSPRPSPAPLPAAAPARASFGSAGFIRRLADLTGPRPGTQGSAGQPLVDRLGPWLGLADAISLATALDGIARRPDEDAAIDAGNMNHLARHCAEVRANLAAAIDADLPGSRSVRRPHDDRGAAPVAPADPADFGPWRRHYAAQQRTMETAIAPLRLELRAALAARSPAQVRLAELDAVMDGVLGPRERSLLASVPGQLERRHAELQRAHAASGEPADPPTWQIAFQRDLKDLLRAELDLRLQPVDGLLAALDLEPTAPR